MRHSAIWSKKEQVQRPVAEYLAKLADADQPAQPGPKKKPPKYISETDPEAAWSLKDGPGRFSYETNYMIDTDHGIIVDVEATPVRLSQPRKCWSLVPSGMTSNGSVANL